MTIYTFVSSQAGSHACATRTLNSCMFVSDWYYYFLNCMQNGLLFPCFVMAPPQPSTQEGPGAAITQGYYFHTSLYIYRCISIEVYSLLKCVCMYKSTLLSIILILTERYYKFFGYHRWDVMILICSRLEAETYET